MSAPPGPSRPFPGALLLAIDTTGERGSIALVAEAGVVEEVALDSPDGFAHVLFGEIEALLTRAGVAVRDIAAFAAASGPGSFTGVRIGLTAAKGLGEATGRPVVAVSNLQALAYFGTAPLRAVVIDARRGEIYGAVYNAALDPVQEEIVARVEQWLASLPNPAQESEIELISNGYPLADVGVQARIIQAAVPLAGAIGVIAFDRFRRGLAQEPVEIDANYVRRSDAELLWKDPAAAPAKGSSSR